LKEYKNIATVLSLIATLVLSSSAVASAETISLTDENSPSNMVISLTDKNDVKVPIGSFTNRPQLLLDWNDISTSAHYELYTWSDARPPSVRLLSSEQISTGATVTELSSSSYEIDLLRDGTYFYAVKAIDATGSVLETSQILTLTFDKTAPRILVVNPKFNQEIIGNSLIASGTISDSNLDYYYFVLRDSAGQTILTSSFIREAVSNDVIANLDISTFLSGNYDIAFVARDKAGNETVLADPDQTASFVVIRKGDGNNFSNPPRPTEPSPAGIVPVLTPAKTEVTNSPKFKLVSTQSVLGITSNQDKSLASFSQDTANESDAKIFAIAKSPVQQSHNVLYLALIPIIFCVLLLTFKKRQTVLNK